MAVVLAESEAEPASWPAVPSGLSPEAAAVPVGAIWGRIEGWICHRWSVREVVFVLEGPGPWVPRLRPFAATSVEVWQGEAWTAVTLPATPLGGYVLEAATYRITGAAGSATTPPESAQEAYRRLAEYFVAVSGDEAHGLSNGSDGDYSFRRSATWPARAIHNSGAADLLRGYRT